MQQSGQKCDRAIFLFGFSVAKNDVFISKIILCPLVTFSIHFLNTISKVKFHYYEFSRLFVRECGGLTWALSQNPCLAKNDYYSAPSSLSRVDQTAI